MISHSGALISPPLVMLLFLSYCFSLSWSPQMGMRGRHANPQFKHWRPPGEVIPKPISPEAIRIFKRMRQHEREFGPWGDRWWQWNRELAGCLGLFEGMAVYEDPAWGSTKFQQTAVDRFFLLERKAAKKPKFKYKWQK
jgi:hypothetical protein